MNLKERFDKVYDSIKFFESIIIKVLICYMLLKEVQDVTKNKN